MKKILLPVLLCFACLAHAQNDLTLSLKVDNEAGIGYLKGVYVRGFLKNQSANDIRIVHPGFAEPLWYADREQWELTYNGHYVQPYRFAERPYTKFSKKKNNLVLKPGDSVAVGVRQVEFKEEGVYTVGLTYKQQKDSVNTGYIDKDDLKDNRDFVVKAEPLTFSIKMKKVTSLSAPLPFAELQYTEPMYSFAQALTNPDKAYRMILRGTTAADLRWLRELKNLQWLEIADANLDTLPSFLSEFKLQYFYFSSAKKAVHFPPALEKLNTLKTIYIGGMKLDSIPGWIYSQKNLEKLEIRVAQLQRLTPTIRTLANLKELIVFWSSFEQVPDELTKMPALEKLTLESGALKSIDFLEAMPGLKFVKIAGSTSFREHPLVNKLKQKNVEAYIF